MSCNMVPVDSQRAPRLHDDADTHNIGLINTSNWNDVHFHFISFSVTETIGVQEKD